MNWLRLLMALQASYFLLTGIWPLVHIRSFMAVTGPKRDLWLVRTVGAVITAIGASIGVAAAVGEAGWPELVLAAGSAAALTCIDVIYVFNGTIARIYLADAIAEVVLIAAWLMLFPWRT